MHQKHSATRGFGFLEIFLAKKRASTANLLLQSKVKKRGDRVLDIGCGSFPYFLASCGFVEKHGVDGYINEVGFKIKGIKLKKIDIEKNSLPYRNNYFDVVTMLAVFEHIHPMKLKNVLSEIKRVLKKDGVLIITTPAPWSVPILWLFSKIGLISKVEIEDHKPLSNPKKIINFLKNAGLEKRRIEYGYFELGFNIWVIARK